MRGKLVESLTDKRRTYTFYVDDAVLDVFGPRIGAYGIAVYTLLARHAKQKQSFPSLKHMVTQLGISRQTITRTIDTLIDAGLITKKKRKSRHGDPDSNLYTLLDLSAYRGPHGSTPQDVGRSPQDVPTSPQDVGVGPHRTYGTSPGDHEGISLKGSHLKEREREAPLPPARRCPAWYEPTEALRQWAQEKYPAVDFEEALAAMRDCEFKTAHRDWQAVMRNWIRREAKWSNGSTRNDSRLTRDEQRAIADEQSTKELEELVNGRNTRFSVWAPLGRDGAGVSDLVRRGSQSRLSHGAR